MSKNSAAHKCYLELKIIHNGAIVDKVRIPTGHLKKVAFSTKVKGTDRLFLLSEEYAQVMEKYV